MSVFSSGVITQIMTDRPDVYAFEIKGHVDDDASEDLAKFMNAAFDQHDKVNMLLDLRGFTGSDWDSLFDGDVLKSRFRSLSHVSRYAVLGAPDGAAQMIEMMDKIIPVEARAFPKDEVQQAWDFVGAKAAA